MSTVKKGDIFEARTFDLIQKFIDNGNIPILKEYCTFKLKPKYYSSNRKSNITFDISIEITPKGADSYHLLYLIECKDYTQKVPVDDIEEFKAKIDQVSGKNVKGVFVCSNGVQEGAYNYAESKGIMLIVLNHNNQHDILLHNAKNNWNQDSPISWSNQIKTNHDKINWDEEVRYLILHCFSNEKEISLTSPESIQQLSKQLISSISKAILNRFNQNICLGKEKLNLIEFLEYLTSTYGIQIIDDVKIAEIRGLEVKAYCSPKTRNIFVDPKLRDTPNFLFVCAHELAHILLHADINIDQYDYDSMEMSKYNEFSKKHDLINDKNWLEWQANYFASALLIPEYALELQIIIWQSQNDINRRGKIFLDNQEVNILAYRKITEYLANFFNVSKATLKYRLDELEMIQYGKNNRINWRNIMNPDNEPKLIGDIMQRMHYIR